MGACGGSYLVRLVRCCYCSRNLGPQEPTPEPEGPAPLLPPVAGSQPVYPPPTYPPYQGPYAYPSPYPYAYPYPYPYPPPHAPDYYAGLLLPRPPRIWTVCVTFVVAIVAVLGAQVVAGMVL